MEYCTMEYCNFYCNKNERTTHINEDKSKFHVEQKKIPYIYETYPLKRERGKMK